MTSSPKQKKETFVNQPFQSKAKQQNDNDKKYGKWLINDYNTNSIHTFFSAWS